MQELEDSIVLILSSDAKNTAFGSGFIVARDQSYSYLLTCAHVLDQINGKPPATENKLKISGVDVAVEIVKCGASDAIDMALLKVAGLFDKPLFEQFMLGQEQADIKVTGYSLFDSKNSQHTKHDLKGKLNNRAKIVSNNQEYPFLDISIQDDDFSKLEGGYSGSPLYNAAGQVLGVISHRRSGEMGHAFCISNLKTLYPEITSLIPKLSHLEKNSRLAQIRTGLLKRMAEIAQSYMKIATRLNQIDKQGVDDEGEIILTMCESFMGSLIDASTFNAFCQSLDAKQADAINSNQLNYKVLAQRLNDGEVALCLGAELPALFDSQLNKASELPRQLAALINFDASENHGLAEVCEYAELHQDYRRRKILVELQKLINPPAHHQPTIALYDLLAELPKPFLTIASGFDTLLRQRLECSRQRFVSIVTDTGNDPKAPVTLLLHYSSGEKKRCSNEELSALQLIENGYSVIYHPRGYLDEQLDTLLLSERDYFNSSNLLERHYPDYLRKKLQERELWFLGYNPDNWETRLLVTVLQRQRIHKREQPLVIQEAISPFAKLFWEDMRCKHYEGIRLTEFVSNIKAAL